MSDGNITTKRRSQRGMRNETAYRTLASLTGMGAAGLFMRTVVEDDGGGRNHCHIDQAGSPEREHHLAIRHVQRLALCSCAHEGYTGLNQTRVKVYSVRHTVAPTMPTAKITLPAPARCGKNTPAATSLQ